MFAGRMFPKVGIATALLLVCAPGTAFAEYHNLGAIAPGDTQGYVFGHGKGTFTDELAFSISQPGSGAADYYNFFVKMGKVRSNIENAQITLTGPAGFTTVSFGLASGASYAIQLISGSYSAKITGNATGSDGGAYNLGVTAPTPEPATMGLMFGGAAAASFMARRRRRAAARIAAA